MLPSRKSNHRRNALKRESAAAIVAVTITVLGITGGVAYSALPKASSGRTAAGPFRQAVGPVVRGAGSRKESTAKCDPNEFAAGGGYIIGGAFRNRSNQSLKSVPVPIESTLSQAQAGATFPNAWTVVAIAPSSFSSKWTLQAYVLCG